MKAPVIVTLLVLALLAPVSVQSKSPEIPDLNDSHLRIPWNDFKKILERIQPPEPEPEPKEEEPPPPEPYLITSAHYDGALSGETAGFDVTIKIIVLDKKNWLDIPILPADLAVENMLLNKKPVMLLNRDGQYHILLKSPGEYTLTGRFWVKSENEAGPSSINFPILETPVTAINFTVPSPGLTIDADPANLNRVINEAKSTRLEAVLPTTDWVTISWSRKIEAAEAELRMNAEVDSLVSIGERLCQVESLVRYEILHRGVTSFKLRLPAGVSVVNVSGQGLIDWKIANVDDKQVVTANLNYEAKGSYQLLVNYETSLPDATAAVDVPEIEVMDVSREIGHLGIAPRTNIEIEVKSFKSLGSVDVSSLPDSIPNRSATPLIFGFKYIGHPWELNLQATKHKEVEILTCTVDNVAMHSFLSKDGELITRAVYTIRNNREQFIRIKLPKDARVFNTFRSGMPVQPAGDEEGRILIPLEKSTGDSGQARSFTIEITYLVQVPKMSRWFGDVSVEAPVSDIMTNEMDWAVYLPKGYKYRVQNASLEETVQMPQPLAGVLSSNEITVDSDGAYFGEDRRARKMQMNAQSNVMPQGNVAFSKKNFVKAELPVRFTVPKEGILLKFGKTIVQEGEANGVSLGYRKAFKPRKNISTRNKILLIILITILLSAVIIRIMRRGKRAGREAGV